jgi:hypothetical protein
VLLWPSDGYLNRPFVNYPIVNVYEFDLNLMQPWRKALDNDRVPAAVYPIPRRLIHCHLDVSKWGRRSVYGGAIPNEDNTTRERLGERGVNDDPGLPLIGVRYS